MCDQEIKVRQRDRNLLAEVGPRGALCQSTAFLRVARLGDITRALWVQAHQDRRPWSQGLMAQGPCTKVSVSLASLLQTPASPHLLAHPYFLSDCGMSEHSKLSGSLGHPEMG